ncbi:MAG: WD40/YVTN/BNR-like repeat-containing protein [Aquabacterium sp.]
MPRRTARPAPVDPATASPVPLVAGPRKARKSGKAAARRSLHKKRAAWFRARITWPLREAPAGRLDDEIRRATRRLPVATGIGTWTLAGPTNVGGRCTSIVCHPTDPQRIWIGAAGGGVWASRDGGRSWRASWSRTAPLQIGALAIDPVNPDVLYAGTGEANLSLDAYPGAGIWRSTNGGRSWRAWALSARTGLPRRIGRLAIDPFDPRHVCVGGVGYGRVSADNDFGGLYVTRDGGASWTRETFVAAGNWWCHEVVFDPVTPGQMFITATERGSRSGIYRSEDGGTSWTRLARGLPSAERLGRTSLAIARSNPRVLYAQVADAASGNDNLLGLYRSADGGNTWRDVAGSHFADEGQMSYGNAIAVHPTDPDHVICGGVDLHRSHDGGATWRTASRWDAQHPYGRDGAPGDPLYAHADHHALLMPAAQPGLVYDANDGGMDASDDGGRHWANRSRGIAAVMYYDLDIAQTDARRFGGGAQDNGTLVTTTGGAGDHWELNGGDGGWMLIDPADADHIVASSQFGEMRRWRNGMGRRITPPFRDQDMGGVWMVFITMDPADGNTYYTGNQRLYRTRNDGLSWDALTPVLDGSPISAIEVAAADRRCIYVGTENGSFFRSTDGGATFSGNLAGSVLPSVTITRIETHPADARRVYVTSANFGNRHVFRSTDGGLTWSDIDGGALPDAPHHALLLRPDAPGELWVCSDAGVHVTRDDGATWLNATGALPRTMVVDLVYHRASRTLYAATYGRSIWKLQLTT